MKSGDLPGFGWMPTIDPSKAATGSLHVHKKAGFNQHGKMIGFFKQNIAVVNYGSVIS